ncbi:hypothetical protein H4R18_005793 [Coemansia javaensis]|uniref:SGF29 C-terminal domain-containing protein n=1 Tax=Coemansia javaensis TaxID=2761396 RepID=A0A9W8H809_9FUNG|nr:hypothetical protein H4R18_005793 [Coemansia javaensis]
MSSSSSSSSSSRLGQAAATTQNLVQQLAAVERARREQRAAQGGAAKAQLARQEQRAADAALDMVDRMLAQLAADASASAAADHDSSDFEDRHAAKRRRPEAHHSASRDDRHRGSEPRSRDRGRDRERDRERDRDHRPRDRSRDRRGAPGGGSTAASSSTASNSNGGGGAAIARGSLVAARVAQAAEQGDEWILATVLSYSGERGRYTVQDYDLDSASRPTYVLPPRLVLYVTEPAGRARRATPWDRAARPELPRGTRVLALYPGTTVFYECSVVVPPALNAALVGVLLPPVPGVPMGPPDAADGAPPHPAANPMYRVQFDDDGGREVNVPAHLVIPLPRARD